MTPFSNATPEQEARREIDRQLEEAGWIIQDRDEIDLSAGLGVAIREFKLKSGHNAQTLEAERAKAAKKYKEPVAPDNDGLPELPEGWCWATVRQVGDVRLVDNDHQSITMVLTCDHISASPMCLKTESTLTM